MAKKIKKSQVLRHVIQLILFLTLPGLYAMTFSELKTVYQMIAKGNFNFIQAFPSLVEFTAVMLLTIIMGRWFCGWLCAFGAYNDFVYAISKRVFKTKFKVNEKVDSVLKYAKYIILVFIIIISWTMGSSILESTSPWDVFGQITNISTVFSSLLIGLILLVLITIGVALIERFFCRYLCPLGAVFAIISKIGIVKINKIKADCGKCRACTVNCSMGLKLYKVNGARGGDCINCLKCTEVCPRSNANVNILGQNVNQNLAGSVAMAAMLGMYGLSNFEADALANSGVISSQTENSTSAASNSTSQKYKDGIYTGTGKGFNGGTTKVAVTIADGKITKIETLSNGDDRQYFDRASGIIIKNIISKQTASVDTVSGATFSSKGIISAVKDALNQAGASESSDSTDNTSTTADPATSNTTSNATESAASISADNTKTPSSKYKDGTYTGTGTGFDGATTKISVTIANGKIANIKTISNGDTPEFYKQASNGIMNKMISTQSASVDTVSGATFSSNGIISAVKNALNQAAGSDSKVDQGNTSSKSSTNIGTSNSNTTQSQPTTPPPVVNQKSTTTPTQSAQTQKSTSSTAGQGSNNTTTSPSASSNTSNSSKGQYKDGTYTGSGSGFGGTTNISVTISNGKITGIKTISNEDTKQYYNRAIGEITNSVISSQSGSVDTVSGATYSSNGIIEAVKSALSKAK